MQSLIPVSIDATLTQASLNSVQDARETEDGIHSSKTPMTLLFGRFAGAKCIVQHRSCRPRYSPGLC